MKISCQHQETSNRNVYQKPLIKLFCFFLITTLFSCTEEKNYYTTADNGKETIYIEGDVTDAEVTAQLADELGSNTQSIYIQNTTQLTSVNIHSATNIRHIEFYNNEQLININISGFKKITGLLFKQNTTRPYPTSPITFTCNDIEDVLSTLDLRLYYTAPGANISFNKLKTVGPDGFILWAKANQLDFPLLEKVSFFSFAVAKDVVTFPSLKYADYISGPAYIEFSQLNFPVLETCKEFAFVPYYNNTNYAEITLPHLNYCEYFRLLYTVNNSSIVNTILHQFLNVLPASGKVIGVTNFSNLAPPTDQGLIDKQTLINLGNEVTTDQ